MFGLTTACGISKMPTKQELDNNGLARIFCGLVAAVTLAAGAWAWQTNDRLARMEVHIENIIKTLEAKP